MLLAYTHFPSSCSFHFLLFWLMLFGSASLHTLRHPKKTPSERRKREKPSQQKKVFYRIVRRAISCGKFLLSLSSLFLWLSVQCCQFSTLFRFPECFKESLLIGWRASQIGMEEDFSWEGCVALQREFSCDKESWRLRHGRRLSGDLCWCSDTIDDTRELSDKNARLQSYQKNLRSERENLKFSIFSSRKLTTENFDRFSLPIFFSSTVEKKNKKVFKATGLRELPFLLSLKPWKRLIHSMLSMCSGMRDGTARWNFLFSLSFYKSESQGRVEECAKW
jgi:hypothetical protein